MEESLVKRSTKGRRRREESTCTTILTQVKEMVDQLRAEVVGNDKAKTALRVSSLFIWHVQEYEVPEKLKLPTIELDDGNTNPHDHIMMYKTMMAIQNSSDVVLCRLFPTTLKGAMRRWYQDLKPKSISSFSKLAQEFMSRSIVSILVARETSYLEMVMQGKDESLRDSVLRFNREALLIPNLDQARAAETM